jgi:DNA-binding transcriptional ArsR family regulator
MSVIYKNRELATDIAEKLRVYAQPQRLMILSCLLRAERTVAQIGEEVAIAQPALSQQLAELRRAELVATRKEAKQVWYSLANDSVRICITTMEVIFSGADLALKMPLAMTKPSKHKPTAAGVAGFAKIV